MKKIKLLVLPSQFPSFEGDIKGIFILDYLYSVSKYCDITVITINRNHKRKETIVKNIGGIEVFEFCYVNNKRKIYKVLLYLSYLNQILKTIRLRKPFDIIHAHNSVINGSIAFFLSKRLKCPYIITEHTNPFSKITKHYLFKVLAKKAIESASALLTVSNYSLRQILYSKMKPKLTFITYNPVDIQTFTINKNSFSNRKFLFVGRLEAYKGALRVLYAFNKIYKLYPDWKFLIIGDGAELKEIICYLKNQPLLSERIHLLGKLSKAQIAKQMNEVDFFVFPSEHETFGIVIAEAMSCGLPVLIGNKTAPPEFVDDKTGLLIDSQNIDELSQALEYMIVNHKNYNRAIIRKKIVENFGFDVFGEKIINIYNEVINVWNSRYN